MRFPCKLRRKRSSPINASVIRHGCAFHGFLVRYHYFISVKTPTAYFGISINVTRVAFLLSRTDPRDLNSATIPFDRRNSDGCLLANEKKDDVIL